MTTVNSEDHFVEFVLWENANLSWRYSTWKHVSVELLLALDPKKKNNERLRRISWQSDRQVQYLRLADGPLISFLCTSVG